MEDEAKYTFMLPPDIWRKKSGPSSYKMTLAEAAKRYPGATPILSSREVRRSGGGAITADAPYCRASRPMTPGEEALQKWLTSRIGMKSECIDESADEDGRSRDTQKGQP